jgi:hypothetical protein
VPSPSLRTSLAGALVAVPLYLLPFAADARSDNAEARKFPHSHITSNQWRELLRETQGKEDAVTVEYAYVMRTLVRTEAAVYFFTKPEHPAHPAAVRRSLVMYSNKMYVHTSGYYAGSRNAFLAWIKLFQAADEKLQHRLQDRDRLHIRLLSDSAIGKSRLEQCKSH